MLEHRRSPLPQGTIDTHVHVFDERFPYAPARSYTPPACTLDDVIAYGAEIGVERFVLVQPSVYGADNRALLYGLAKLEDRGRGVAVIDDTTTDTELALMHASGVRGLRLNVKSDPGASHPDIRPGLDALIARAEPLGLFVEIFASAQSIDDASRDIAASPVPILLDHFGGIHAHGDWTITGTVPLVELLGLGHVWVKLSAPYRVGDPAQTQALLPGVVRLLADTRPDRLLWASDFPHTGGGAARKERGPEAIEPFRDIDDLAAAHEAASWFTDPDDAHRMFVDNPATLYGFEPATVPAAGGTTRKDNDV